MLTWVIEPVLILLLVFQAVTTGVLIHIYKAGGDTQIVRTYITHTGYCIGK